MMYMSITAMQLHISVTYWVSRLPSWYLPDWCLMLLNKTAELSGKKHLVQKVVTINNARRGDARHVAEESSRLETA